MRVSSGRSHTAMSRKRKSGNKQRGRKDLSHGGSIRREHYARTAELDGLIVPSSQSEAPKALFTRLFATE